MIELGTLNVAQDWSASVFLKDHSWEWIRYCCHRRVMLYWLCCDPEPFAWYSLVPLWLSFPPSPFFLLFCQEPPECSGTDLLEKPPPHTWTALKVPCWAKPGAEWACSKSSCWRAGSVDEAVQSTWGKIGSCWLCKLLPSFLAVLPLNYLRAFCVCLCAFSSSLSPSLVTQQLPSHSSSSQDG